MCGRLFPFSFFLTFHCCVLFLFSFLGIFTLNNLNSLKWKKRRKNEQKKFNIWVKCISSSIVLFLSFSSVLLLWHRTCSVTYYIYYVDRHIKYDYEYIIAHWVHSMFIMSKWRRKSCCKKRKQIGFKWKKKANNKFYHFESKTIYVYEMKYLRAHQYAAEKCRKT